LSAIYPPLPSPPGVSNKKLGPAVSVAIDRNTGEMAQVFLDNAEGDVPARLNPLLKERLPEARDIDYVKTHGRLAPTPKYTPSINS